MLTVFCRSAHTHTHTQNHDIDDVIGHPSHMAPQSQYSSNPPHKKPTES